MKPATTHRKGIPFFYSKTALKFQQDVYEHYDEMVVRQSALHLADELWGKYLVIFVNLLDCDFTKTAFYERNNKPPIS